MDVSVLTTTSYGFAVSPLSDTGPFLLEHSRILPASPIPAAAPTQASPSRDGKLLQRSCLKGSKQKKRLGRRLQWWDDSVPTAPQDRKTERTDAVRRMEVGHQSAPSAAALRSQAKQGGIETVKSKLAAQLKASSATSSAQQFRTGLAGKATAATGKKKPGKENLGENHSQSSRNFRRRGADDFVDFGDGRGEDSSAATAATGASGSSRQPLQPRRPAATVMTTRRQRSLEPPLQALTDTSMLNVSMAAELQLMALLEESDEEEEAEACRATASATASATSSEEAEASSSSEEEADAAVAPAPGRRQCPMSREAPSSPIQCLFNAYLMPI